MSRQPRQRRPFVPSRVRLRAETAQYRKFRRKVWAAFALGVLLTAAAIFGADYIGRLPLGAL
jgi:FtsH-binding integral membrane protein